MAIQTGFNTGVPNHCRNIHGCASSSPLGGFIEHLLEQLQPHTTAPQKKRKHNATRSAASTVEVGVYIKTDIVGKGDFRTYRCGAERYVCLPSGRMFVTFTDLVTTALPPPPLMLPGTASSCTMYRLSSEKELVGAGPTTVPARSLKLSIFMLCSCTRVPGGGPPVASTRQAITCG